ncbi:MAG: TonB-dependent receptor [Burkholderiaceae bacterium]|nr:TonB-dependent receptor [Burkholderiaceae bacterium]
MTPSLSAAMRMHAVALAALATFLPAAALAQSDGGTVIVTGTRLPASAAGLAQSVTVIDQAEIQRLHAARVEDILGRVTGAYVDQAGATGSFASMYMRGAENSHLLILLDGVKLNDPTTTRGSAYDLSAIDLSQIDRIEVLRGPASAVYGGEALAGVVHIITKRAAAQGVAGSGYLALGGDHHRKAGASVSFGPENVRAQLSAGTSHDGSSGSDDGKLRLGSVSGSVRLAPGAGLDVEGFASHTDRKSEAFPDDSGGPRLAVNRAKTLRDSKDQALGVRVGWGDAKRVRIEGHLSRFDRDEHSDNAFVDGGVRFPVPPFISDTNMTRTNAQVLARHDYGSGASVVAGLEHQVEDGDLTSVGDFFGLGTPQTLSFALKRKTNAVFAEGRLQVLPGVAVQIGVRRDKVEGIESVTTPHLGAVWELPNGATTLKASYGKGFKPPSFFALGFPIGGNPDLRPERSVNGELSVTHKLDAAGSAVQVSVFQIDYKDLVDFDGTTFTNVNRGTIVVKGIEPELRWRVLDRVRLQLGATLLNIDVRDGLQPLRNRPETRATAQVVFEIDGRRSAFVGMNHTGTFLDRSNPTGDIAMPAYTVVDAGYQVQYGAFRVKLSIDNLFDKNYEQFVGFPGQGRRLRAEVRTSF